MANKFGAKVSIKADKSAESAKKFRTSVQTLANSATEKESIKINNIKANNTDKNIKAFRSSVQAIINSGTEKNPIKINNIEFAPLTKKDTDRLIGDIKNRLKDTKDVSIRIEKIDATNAVKTFRDQLKTMLDGLNIGGLKEYINAVDAGDETAAADKIAEANKKAEESAIRAANALARLKNMQSMLDATYKGISNIENSEEKSVYIEEYQRLIGVVADLRVNRAKATDEALNNADREVIALNQMTVAEGERGEATKKAANEQVKASAEARAAYNSEISLAKSATALKDRILRYEKNNPRASKIYKSEFDELKRELTDTANLSGVKLKQIGTSLTQLQMKIRSAGNEGVTIMQYLKDGWARFGGWSIVTKSMTKIAQIGRSILENVKAVDAAMTELKKVTDLTDSSYDALQKKAANMAKNVGASIADAINATADFARLGYDPDEALQLSEAALVYKNVGDGIEDISEASESLISTMKAFGIEAANSMEIVDKFNKIGNEFAISSKGIGTALQKSASALATAGNSLEESIAIVTAMNAVIQDPEIVGTAAKSLSMYLRAAKTEAEKAGEATDGMAESVSKLRAKILKLTKDKVDIMIDNSSFKNTFQIVKEIAEVWDSIPDVDRASLLELIAGKRNATAVTSLITNFKDAEAALYSAKNATGSATAENEKFKNSIEGSITQLKSEFEDFSTAVLSSKFVSGATKFLGHIIELINVIIDKAGLLPTIIGTTVAVVKGKFGYDKSAGELIKQFQF